ncbi:MAG: GGDEF domain-containing response regulator [Planctomycetota bacterium]
MGKIIVAEDDHTIRKILVKAMAKLADTVLEADNGVDAWGALENNDDIDLIVSDWMMPELDGFELLRRVKSDTKYIEIPFIMMTAKDQDDDVLQGFEGGADDYIKKPCNIAEVMARARNLIKMKQIQDELRTKSITDGLTKLYNHRFFMEQVNKEIERATRYGGAISLIMFDIDHFKKFNDEHGHQAGDFILSHLGDIIKSTMRNVDFCARYGGEEFAVILPGTARYSAEYAAKRLFEKIKTENFDFQGKDFKITVSMGLTEFTKGDTDTSIIKRADEALYKAKHEGRDRICVFEE